MTNPPTERPQADDTLFPPEAWRDISLTAPPSLALYGPRNRGHVELSLSNGSGETLATGRGQELAFSFHLLGADGEELAFEGPRTPLTAPVPPGGLHQQKVAVIVPRALIDATAAIRVGLLVEGRFWVESLVPAHGQTVAIEKPQGLGSVEARLAEASQVWPPGKGNGLRWPYGTMMVSEDHKLMYIPVAKCACTSLKSLMVRLAGVEQADMAMELGVHFVTDRFNTGVQLKDKPMDLARQILASSDYFKFSVIRDPFERLVSAYLEKFVYRRHSQRNLMHTRPVIGAVQGSEDIDLDAGISFDQFLAYILGQDPYDLDPHWRPQYLYFLGVPHISRIFRLEEIGELENHLLQHLGITVQLGHENKTSKSDILLPGACSLSAGELDTRGAFNPDSFLATPHADAIREYYRQDFEFYRSAC